MSEKSRAILKKQKTVLIALIATALFIAIGISYLSFQKTPYVHPAPKPLDLPADKINPQEIWMSRIESENKMIDQEIKVLKEMLLGQTQHHETSEKEKQDLKKEISRLKQQLHTLSEQPTPQAQTQQLIAQAGDPFFAPTPLPPPLPSIPIKLHEVVMEDIEIKQVGNVNKTIPGNVTVRAILVSGLDAVCGAYATTNPIPVKLRVIEEGYGYAGQKIKLKGAIISGSAYGSLSDERVYIRLERLTQFNGCDEFIETEVAGYVSGEDGKYGLRGKMADKSLQVIKNAAVSGIFAETSQVLQSALSRYTIDNTLTNQSGASYGAVGQGASARTSNAFDMLSEYYIRRAEQISPVIQINPGRVVDVTFLHSADIGDIHIKEKIKIVRETARQNHEKMDTLNDTPFFNSGIQH